MLVRWWCCVVVGMMVVTPTQGWSAQEMQFFDTIEEVNQNFYELLGVTQDAPLSEIKKAYRRLSLLTHPDKNDSPDAEEKFRQLVSVYEILRDEEQRAHYDQLLIDGLPDWRSAIYYYRKARKMSMVEISIILTVVISVTQYLMAWGSYIDKKHCMEETLLKKYKIKDGKKKKAEDLENIQLMEEELSQIPKPRKKNGKRRKQVGKSGKESMCFQIFLMVNVYWWRWMDLSPMDKVRGALSLLLLQYQ
ncbi:hypothetical protein OTU49_011723 [Cherax quadricarinatus]|uniref:J domain-containing protein n=1 Tax=Cherax quadricarinatus TaxID=27406 RepID=A0AAW0W5G9_CHEQU